MVSKSCFRPPFWFGRLFRFLIGTRNVAEGDHFHQVVLHGENLLFITSAIIATVAEGESSFTLRETCLATEIKQSFTKPTILHLAKPAETSLVSQRLCT